MGVVGLLLSSTVPPSTQSGKEQEKILMVKIYTHGMKNSSA
jgi:hypothetical protein